MQLPETVEPAPFPPQPAAAPSFRDMPWQWRDVLIGFAPLVVASVIFPMRSRTSAPGWLWLPIACIGPVWMLGYPLRVVRRRIGLPAWPRPRSLIVQTLLAIPALLGTLIAVTLVSSALVRVFGEAAQPTNPFETFVMSATRFQRLSLFILGVLVAPFAEEVFFRGMLYNALRQRIHPIPAALLQAIVFGIVHPFGWAERVGVSVIGFFLAMFYEWRKTLVAPIVLHSLVNALSLSMLYSQVDAYANSPVLGVQLATHEKGCLVTKVEPGSAAEEAGIRVGDVIVAVDKFAVRNLRDTINVMHTKQVGDKVPLWYIRDGKMVYIEQVTLKARPE